MEKRWLSRKDATEITNSPRIVQQFIKAGWLQMVRGGKKGQRALYTRKSLDEACQRIENGEIPFISIKKKTNEVKT